MTSDNVYSVVFSITALVVAVPVYSSYVNRQEVGQVMRPAVPSAVLQGSDERVRTLVNRYMTDNNWALFKSELKRELNTSSRAYSQVLNIHDDARYPLEQMSSSVNYLDLLGTLLDGGLGPDVAVSPDNWTMLHFSVEHGIRPVAEVLLRHGANSNARTSTQDTPVIIAAWRNHLPVVKLLHEHGADLNSQNEDGRTALHRAAYWGNANVVKYLVDSCADTAITTKLGNTPLDDARNRGYTDIIEMITKQMCL